MAGLADNPYYVPRQGEPPNAFNAFWASFFQVRTPMAQALFAENLSRLRPQDYSDAIGDLLKKKGDYVEQMARAASQVEVARRQGDANALRAIADMYAVEGRIYETQAQESGKTFRQQAEFQEKQLEAAQLPPDVRKTMNASLQAFGAAIESGKAKDAGYHMNLLLRDLEKMGLSTQQQGTVHRELNQAIQRGGQKLGPDQWEPLGAQLSVLNQTFTPTGEPTEPDYRVGGGSQAQLQQTRAAFNEALAGAGGGSASVGVRTGGGGAPVGEWQMPAWLADDPFLKQIEEQVAYLQGRQGKTLPLLSFDDVRATRQVGTKEAQQLENDPRTSVDVLLAAERASQGKPRGRSAERQILDELRGQSEQEEAGRKFARGQVSRPLMVQGKEMPVGKTVEAAGTLTGEDVRTLRGSGVDTDIMGDPIKVSVGETGEQALLDWLEEQKRKRQAGAATR